MKLSQTVIASVVCGVVALGSVQASTTDAVVKQFVPQRLIEAHERAVKAGAPNIPFTQAWKPLTPSADVVVAAYADGMMGDVRVLKIEGDQGSVLWEPEQMFGSEDPRIYTLDIDGDGHLDFIVTFLTGQGRYTTSRVFLFDGTSVKDATPDDGLNAPEFIDIDGDGVKELVDGYKDDDGNDVSYLYRLKGGEFNQSERVLYFGRFVRGDAKPVTQTGTFASTVASATLLVVNGADGAPRSAAIDVQLNGEKVVSRDQLNETLENLEIPISLLTGEDVDNQIACTVLGKPGASIGLLVYIASPEAGTNAPSQK